MSDALSNAAPQAAAEISSQLAPESTTPKQEASKTEASSATSSSSEAKSLQEKAESGEKLTKKEEKALKEYKIKVYGKEKSVKFDPSNDEEVVKYLQKAEASDLKFAEANELRKAALEFIDELKKNPRKVLSDPNIGVDIKKFAEEILNEELQEMEKSPEQKEREKLQKEIEQLRQQAKEREESAQRSEFEKMQVEQERILDVEITAALDVGGIPKTARTVKAMAEMMMIALENNIDLSPKDIAPIVKNTTMSEFKELVGSLADDQLEDFLGKEVIGRLRKRNVAKAKALDTANSIKATGNDVKKPEDKKSDSKKMTIRDFLKV